jgi:hypothetical protein
VRTLATHFNGGAVPSLGFGDKERAQHVGGVPTLGPGGEHHLFVLLTHVFEAESTAQRDHLVDGDPGALAHDPASPGVLV